MVYPRVCGGTTAFTSSHSLPVGLSPRVRGNLRHRVSVALVNRSIPACAGEPYSHGGGEWRVQVYPRVCGGTFRLVHHSETINGLSPRVRGNP